MLAIFVCALALLLTVKEAAALPLTGINNPKDGNPKDGNDGGGKDTSRLGKSGIPWAPDDPASVLQDSLRSTFEACATANQEMEQAGMEEGGTGRRAGRWEGYGIHRPRQSCPLRSRRTRRSLATR